MINCRICDLRHRDSQKCEQQFATVIRHEAEENSKYLLPNPIEPKTIKGVVGAAMFSKKRLRPPLNKRQNQFVELARSLTPDEYTPEELEIARARARRVLANKHGRFGFLPSLWRSRKETKEKQNGLDRIPQ